MPDILNCGNPEVHEAHNWEEQVVYPPKTMYHRCWGVHDLPSLADAPPWPFPKHDDDPGFVSPPPPDEPWHLTYQDADSEQMKFVLGKLEINDDAGQMVTHARRARQAQMHAIHYSNQGNLAAATFWAQMAQSSATLALAEEQHAAAVVAYVASFEGMAEGHKEWLERDFLGMGD